MSAADNIERRARAMLAAEYELAGMCDRQGQPMIDRPGPKFEIAVRAIVKALQS